MTTKDLFIIVLAVLTASSGLAMVVMFLKRRREQRRASERLARMPSARRLRHPAERRAADDELLELVDVEEVTEDAYVAPELGMPPRLSFSPPVGSGAVHFAAHSGRPGQGERRGEGDLGKICPSCAKRYGSHHRFCDRDNSELAALN